MIVIVSITIVWLMAATIKREREQYKNDLKKQCDMYVKDLKTCTREYKRLHKAYEQRRAIVRTEMIKDIHEELKGLNGRVTTSEEAKRKRILKNTREYLRG